MRKSIYILLLVIWCFGSIYCEYQEEDSLKNIKVKQMYDYDFENDLMFKILNLKMALSYMTGFQYELDITKFNVKDYWQTPEEFFYNREGDCDCFSIFLLYIAWTILDIDDCYLVDLYTNKEGSYHCIVQINGIYYEPQNGLKIYYIPEEKIRWKAHYTEAIWMTVNYHDNVGKYY